MKRFRNDVILTTLAVSLATGAAALAEDTKYDPQNEIGKGTTRGIDIRPIVPIPTAPVVKPQPAVVKQPAVQPCKNQTPKTPVAIMKPVVKPGVKHPVTTPTVAKTSPKVNAKESEMATATPVQPNQGQFVNVSHQVPVAAATSGSVVIANLDKGGSVPKYKVGDKLVVNIKATQDCNLVVFNYDSTGTLTQIFPNEYQQSGFVRNGDTVQIGGPESPFDYQVAGKGGQEKIFVYAYPTGTSEAPLTVAMNPLAGTPFRSAEITPDQYRQMVNDSKVFFSREVKVVPKRVQNASASSPAAQPNKVELTFVVEK